MQFQDGSRGGAVLLPDTYLMLHSSEFKSYPQTKCRRHTSNAAEI